MDTVILDSYFGHGYSGQLIWTRLFWAVILHTAILELFWTVILDTGISVQHV